MAQCEGCHGEDSLLNKGQHWCLSHLTCYKKSDTHLVVVYMCISPYASVSKGLLLINVGARIVIVIVTFRVIVFQDGWPVRVGPHGIPVQISRQIYQWALLKNNKVSKIESKATTSVASTNCSNPYILPSTCFLRQHCFSSLDLYFCFFRPVFFLHVGRTKKKENNGQCASLFVSPGQFTRQQTSQWPRRQIRVQFLCSVPLAVVSMATPGLMACALCATRSTCQDRTMEESVPWALWVRPAVILLHMHRKKMPPSVHSCTPVPVWLLYTVECSPSGSSSGSTAEASAIQRLEATLHNAAAAAVAAAEVAAEAAASAEAAATEALR